MRPIEFFMRPAILVCSLAVFCVALGVVQVGQLNTTDVVVAQGDPGDTTKKTGSDDTTKKKSGKKAPRNYLQWMFGALGFLYTGVFMALSFTLVALIVMNLLTARRENVRPSHLIDEFEILVEEKQYQEAYDMASTDDSFLGQVLAAGLKGKTDSDERAKEAMEEVAEDELMKLEHRLSHLALIGTISPMIGLFGTVHGMIDSFRTLATTVGANPDAQILAEGISTALFTTLLGLFIAIPALTAYNILKNRVSRLAMEVGHLSELLIGKVPKVGGAKK